MRSLGWTIASTRKYTHNLVMIMMVILITQACDRLFLASLPAVMITAANVRLRFGQSKFCQDLMGWAACLTLIGEKVLV